MPKKSQGPSVFPTGQRMPTDIDQGVGQRQFFPGGPGASSGPDTFDQGHRFGKMDPVDKQKAHHPVKITGKGPQTHKSSRFGNLDNQNQDPSRPFNP